MSLQAALKIISATLTLEDIRHFDKEIEAFLSSKTEPAAIAEYLRQRFGKGNQLEVRVSGHQAELKWTVPVLNAEAENSHREALALAKQKDFFKAIAKWTQAISLNSSDPDYFFHLGIAFFENKNYKEATENLSQSIALCPIYHRAHLILGTILLKLRKFAEAETHLKESIYFSPRHALAHLNLGAVYSILKKYKEGIASFQRAIELAPREIRAYFGLAKIHSILGDTENANANYRKVIELDPAGPLANHAKRGIVSKTAYETDEIVDLESLYSEGYKAFLYSDFKGAVTLYQKYLEKRPDDDQGWSTYGVALQRAGLTERATQAFEKATTLNPSKALYFKQLAVAYDFLDRPEEAVQAAAKAHELGKSDSILLSVWGKNLIKANRLTEALTHLERAAKLNRANLLAHYHLALTLARMGEVDRAASHLETVIGAKINTPLKAEAQSQIRRLRSP